MNKTKHILNWGTICYVIRHTRGYEVENESGTGAYPTTVEEFYALPYPFNSLGDFCPNSREESDQKLRELNFRVGKGTAGLGLNVFRTFQICRKRGYLTLLPPQNISTLDETPIPGASEPAQKSDWSDQVEVTVQIPISRLTAFIMAIRGFVVDHLTVRV